jgi:hypothetical protein
VFYPLPTEHECVLDYHRAVLLDDRLSSGSFIVECDCIGIGVFLGTVSQYVSSLRNGVRTCNCNLTLTHTHLDVSYQSQLEKPNIRTRQPITARPARTFTVCVYL